MASDTSSTQAGASTQAFLCSAHPCARNPLTGCSMKISMSALAVLLCTIALCFEVFSAPVGADTPTACCFTYVAKKIPRPYVADYFETNSQCSQPGVIFITKKGRQICADPSEAWVQEYINDLELNA